MSEKNELTLLDRFAIAALPEIMRMDGAAAEAQFRADNQQMPEDVTACWEEPDRWADVAQASYALAEAMMVERKKQLEKSKPRQDGKF